MQNMPLRTKLTAFGFASFLLILYVVINPDNPNTPLIVGLLGGAMILSILGDLFPKLRARLTPYARPFLLILLLVNLVALIIAIIYPSINGSFSTDNFLIVFVPVLVLIVPFFVVLYLGPILAKLGKLKAAENLYSFMIRINPKFGLGYLQRGLLRHAQRDVENAFADYDRALEIAKAKLRRKPYFSNNYSAASIYANKAELYLYKNDPQQAIFECNMGLSLHENQPVINLLLQYRRGYAQLVNENYDGALQDLNTLHFEGKAAAQEKNFAPDINALKAISLAGLGRIDEAKSFWAKAVAANPDFNKSEWLVQTRLWPPNLLTLAERLY